MAEHPGMDPHDPHSPHRRVWDTIPWFVAGSAGDAERALLEAHLPHCPECREELQFQQQVRAGMQAQPAAAPDPGPALQRLLARIDATAGDATAAALPRHHSRPLTRWLAAAVVVQAVGLGAAVLALRGPGHEPDDPGRPDYRTLSQPDAAAAAAAILLVPAPGMDFAALRRLLADAHLAIVATAPDASSLRLAPLDGDARTAAAALPRLRALPGVLLAEPSGHGR